MQEKFDFCTASRYKKKFRGAFFQRFLMIPNRYIRVDSHTDIVAAITKELAPPAQLRINAR